MVVDRVVTMAIVEALHGVLGSSEGTGDFRSNALHVVDEIVRSIVGEGP